MKKLIALIILTFTINVFAVASQANESKNCRWVGDDFAEGFEMYSKAAKESLGWIICDDMAASSIILQKSANDKMSLMKKVIKQSLPDERSTRWSSFSKTTFGDKIVTESLATNSTVFHVFYFVEIKNKPYMMFATILDNKLKNETINAIDNVLSQFIKDPKKFPKLLAK